MTDRLSHLVQFANDLHQEVQQRAGDEANPQMREDAFTEFVLELLAEHNESDGADVCYLATGGRGRLPAAKLNAWSLSGDGATLDLFVVVYLGSGSTEQVARGIVQEHFKLLRGFLAQARDGYYTRLEESHEAFGAAQRIFEAKETLTTVRLFLLTDGVVKSMDIDQEQLPELELRYVLWDLEKLTRLRVGHRETISLDFVNDYDGAIPCLQMADCTGEYRTFLAFLKAPLLAQIYGQHGQRLLERNVRAYLQSKGKINKGLQETLRDEPHRFLAYNNGLCCTAATVTLQAGRDGQPMLDRVTDFQIVNGAQTTASIFHAMRKEKVDIKHVVVQVKLTVLSDPNKVFEIVPLISKYANSQNKVNGADLSATGQFHRHLENLSRTVWAPPMSGLDRGSHWYYERARGSYLDDKGRQGTPSRQREWVRNNPPERKFTKTDLAKYEHAWIGAPHIVCRGAEKCFLIFAEELEEQGEPSVDLNYFKRAVAKAMLFRAAEKLFTSLKLEGYRANAVAYAVSWVSRKSGYRINLDRIWEEQKVPPLTEGALGAACQAAYMHITGTAGNPGEWSKKPECWDSFRDKEINLPQGWEAEWAERPFVILPTRRVVSEGDWNRVRQPFVADNRTLRELEELTGLKWMASFRNQPVRSYATRLWSNLKGQGGRRLKKLGDLVGLLEKAAQLSPTQVAPQLITEDMVTGGRTVRLTDLADGSEQVFRLVDEVTFQPAGDGTATVSLGSPFGLALLGRRIGETVRVQAPRGAASYRIEDVR